MAEINESTIHDAFGLDILPGWPVTLLHTLNDACTDLIATFGGSVPGWMQGLKLRAEQIQALGLTSPGLIRLRVSGPTKWTIVHEFGHAWDFTSGCTLSRQMKQRTGSSDLFAPLRSIWPEVKLFWYHVGSPPPPCGTDKYFTAMEDFAESVTAYVYPESAKQKAAARNYPYSDYQAESFFHTARGRYIHDLIAAINGEPPH